MSDLHIFVSTVCSSLKGAEFSNFQGWTRVSIYLFLLGLPSRRTTRLLFSTRPRFFVFFRYYFSLFFFRVLFFCVGCSFSENRERESYIVVNGFREERGRQTLEMVQSDRCYCTTFSCVMGENSTKYTNMPGKIIRYVSTKRGGKGGEKVPTVFLLAIFFRLVTNPTIYYSDGIQSMVKSCPVRKVKS